jgi:hypothetical protein
VPLGALTAPGTVPAHMRGKKWTVLAWLVAIMLAGSLATALLAKRQGNRDRARAAAAAKRWYGPNTTVRVSDCRLVAPPAQFVGSKTPPRALYECTVVRQCAQRQQFLIPVPNGEISTHALATPHGAPTPRHCS